MKPINEDLQLAKVSSTKTPSQSPSSDRSWSQVAGKNGGENFKSTYTRMQRNDV